MLRACLVGALALTVLAARPQAAPPLSLAFSTYFGGSDLDHIRDVAFDAQGNIYVAGGSSSPDYPTTPGAYDRTHNGSIDVVVTKLDPTGRTVIWSTYVGGPSLDRAYAIEVDSQGYVYVAGRAGDQFPTTAGAVQTAFRGGPPGGPYPSQDKFFLKLQPDGSGLVYSSYFGAFDDPSHPIRDIAIDGAGNVFLATSTTTGNYAPPVLSAFQNGFDSTHAGMRDGVVAKVNSAGSQVLWATYVGGSGTEWGEASIRTDASGNAYYLTNTDSTNIPTTAGAYDRSFNGVWDFYVTKISAGGALVWGTYLGGSGMEHVETHELAVDGAGNVIVASCTTSTDYPVTPGAYDTLYNGSGGSGTGANSNYPGDVVVTKIAANGAQLVASTYLGGRFGEAGEGVAVDPQGRVYVTGGTYSDNFPTTAGAFRTGPAGGLDGFLVMLSADLKTLLYSTYIGSSGHEALRCAAVDGNGNVATGDGTGSAGWPVLNAIQPTLRGPGDGTLAKFSPPPSPGADSDGDGLPDAWEMTHFGNLSQDAFGDPDGDGLNNLGEHQHGADPTAADTDGDGLSDGAEVNQHGTDPASADGDGDGMSDGFEVTHGFDPGNADQDANGVLDGQDDWDGDGLANAVDPAPGTAPAPAAGGGRRKDRCGATGAEVLLLWAFLAAFRRRA